MNNINHTRIVDFLARYGITDKQAVDDVVSGFDLGQPVYFQTIEPGDRLFQFMRRPSLNKLSPTTGNWFALAGATMNSLAIFSGNSGRNLTEFAVRYPVHGLEGTAGPFARDWEKALGGKGGSTQIYLPRQALFSLECLGTHL